MDHKQTMAVSSTVLQYITLENYL